MFLIESPSWNCISRPVPSLVETGIQLPPNSVTERSTTYRFPSTDGQRMVMGCWLPGALLADACSTDARSFGSVPALYSCQLLAPSPSASAGACESRLLRVPK